MENGQRAHVIGRGSGHCKIKMSFVIFVIFLLSSGFICDHVIIYFYLLLHVSWGAFKVDRFIFGMP